MLRKVATHICQTLTDILYTTYVATKLFVVDCSVCRPTLLQKRRHCGEYLCFIFTRQLRKSFLHFRVCKFQVYFIVICGRQAKGTTLKSGGLKQRLDSRLTLSRAAGAAGAHHILPKTNIACQVYVGVLLCFACNCPRFL